MLECLKVTFFSGSKKSVVCNDERRLSTNSLQMASPYFLAFSKLSLMLSDSRTPVDRLASSPPFHGIVNTFSRTSLTFSTTSESIFMRTATNSL